jgi:hypothetical protein
LVGVFTLIGAESSLAVESVRCSIAFVLVQIPVYITTVSHLPFAIASQTVTVSDRVGTAAIIGGLIQQVVQVGWKQLEPFRKEI